MGHLKVINLVNYFSTPWELDEEAVRSAYCKQVEQCFKQLGFYENSMNISQNSIDTLDNENINFEHNLYSLRSIFDSLLTFPEKHKILVRKSENRQKELASQRGKIYSNFIRTDVLEIRLTGVENFLVWYNQLLKVMEKCGDTIDQGILLAQIKRSINHPDDVANTKSMSWL